MNDSTVFLIAVCVFIIGIALGIGMDVSVKVSDCEKIGAFRSGDKVFRCEVKV